ncbi:MAG: hypothetical protein U1F33_05555 [Alphaproteobacteria bacterium]|mgnify:CR=1 FL=1
MIQKLFLLIVVGAIVWIAAKAYRRYELDRRRHEDREAQRVREGAIEAQEMVKCPRCATYVAGPLPASCGRSDCPYPA